MTYGTWQSVEEISPVYEAAKEFVKTLRNNRGVTPSKLEKLTGGEELAFIGSMPDRPEGTDILKTEITYYFGTGRYEGHTPETKSVRLTEPRVSTLTLAYRPVIDVARINSKAIEAGMSLEECVLEGKGDFLIPGSFRRGESNVETPVDQVFQFNTLVLYTLTPEAYQTMRAATERAR